MSRYTHTHSFNHSTPTTTTTTTHISLFTAPKATRIYVKSSHSIYIIILQHYTHTDWQRYRRQIQTQKQSHKAATVCTKKHKYTHIGSSWIQHMIDTYEYHSYYQADIYRFLHTRCDGTHAYLLTLIMVKADVVSHKPP